MIPSYKKIHSQLRINGFGFNRERLLNMGAIYIKEGEPFMRSIGEFLLNWLDSKDYIEVYTSGTTAAAKKIQLKKRHMVQSALATGLYLDLKPGDTALCCLPIDFIAGKMMIVRAMVLGLDLEIVQPSSMPLSLTEKSFDFCAMVPMQALQSVKSLDRVKKLLLGGGVVDDKLTEQLRNLSTQVYCSYGMTETVSHIAIRKVNHIADDRQIYYALPHVNFSTDEQQCLIIDAPRISDHKVYTHDVVELISPQAFIWKGRKDNMINSAGFKIFPERVEYKLSSYIKEPYFVAGESDPLYGDIAVLYIQTKDNAHYTDLLSQLQNDSQFLRYEIPKKIYCLSEFETTATYKIKREETQKKHHLLKVNNTIK